MLIRNSVMAAAIVILATACATSIPMRSDFDPEQNFSEYRTFTWADERGIAMASDDYIDPFQLAEIQNHLRDALEAKGYQFRETYADADFAVGFTVGTRRDLDLSSKPMLVAIDPVWGIPYYKVDSMSRIDYTEGMLAIDIFDIERRTPVWHAYGDKRLSRSEIAGRTDNSREAVFTLISEFPPGGISNTDVSENDQPCGALEHANWGAWINAMPGPDQQGRKLYVTGEVTVPTSGHTVQLLAGRADRSMRPLQQMNLKITPPTDPAGQVLTTLQARYEGPAIAPEYKSIWILCGGELITEINDIETVY